MPQEGRRKQGASARRTQQVCNPLTVNGLTICHLSACKRSPFTFQKTTFRLVKCDLLEKIKCDCDADAIAREKNGNANHLSSVILLRKALTHK